MKTVLIAVCALAAGACKASPNESTAPTASAPVASITAVPTVSAPAPTAAPTATTAVTTVSSGSFVERAADGGAHIRALSATEQREREKQSLDALKRRSSDSVQHSDPVDPY